jgi:hypothetical protein
MYDNMQQYMTVLYNNIAPGIVIKENVTILLTILTISDNTKKYCAVLSDIVRYCQVLSGIVDNVIRDWFADSSQATVTGVVVVTVTAWPGPAALLHLGCKMCTEPVRSLIAGLLLMAAHSESLGALQQP